MQQMEVVDLKSSVATSRAFIQWEGLRHLPQTLWSAGFLKRIFIITDTEVHQLYGQSVQNILEKADFVPFIFTVPAGESSKSFIYLQQIIDWLVSHKAERQEPVLALGGGVIGDLAGFAAACYLRGVPLIQVPTTLLAQVDSAIGGKTGINHPLGKNLIGAFYQPKLIVVDPAFLLTLPERVYREGWAEIVKYGVILDADLFALLEASSALLLERDAALLSKIITRSIQLKMDVVGGDERDSGLRNILNYGHTFGHALEALTDYGTWMHGEAVSIGMEVAARIAVAKGLFSNEDAARQRHLLQALNLPTTCQGLDIQEALSTMLRDKKVESGRMRWILPTQIGQVAIYNDIPVEMVSSAIMEVAGPA